MRYLSFFGKERLWHLAGAGLPIIGMGNVGMALAHHLVIGGICDDLCLIGRNQNKVWAEAEDLQHVLGYADTKQRVYAGTYTDCRDADIVVLAVGAPYHTGMTRLDMLESAARIVATVTEAVMQSGFSGIFLVITNPVDSMTYLVRRVSGLPDRQVIGTGTGLDSARLRQYLAELIGVDAGSVSAVCMGEHGDSQMIPWSQATVGGKNFLEILQDDPERFSRVHLDSVAEEIAKIAYRIVQYKGSTSYGISAVAARMMRAIISDENLVMPVSVIPHGEYGLTDVCLGLPAVLNAAGVRELVEYHLLPEEQDALTASAKILRKANAEIA